MSVYMEWQGLDALYARILDYQSKVELALLRIAQYWAPIIEAEAKANAEWTDRTGNARQGLTGFVDDVSQTMVIIYLAHRMDYGVYLELAHQARYAIIMPTLEAHYKPIWDHLKEVFT